MKCEVCNGSGVLIGAAYVYDGFRAFDLDNVARCDSCKRYVGDLEAATALAQQQELGCYLVWPQTLEGNLPATEQTNIYIRCSPGDAASLQLDVLRESCVDETPTVIVQVDFISICQPYDDLRNAIMERDAASWIDTGKQR